MSNKVLIYSRFPKAMMVRIGQRFELLDAAGKSPSEVFAADQLSEVTAMVTAGGTPLGAAAMLPISMMAREPARSPCASSTHSRMMKAP